MAYQVTTVVPGCGIWGGLSVNGRPFSVPGPRVMAVCRTALLVAAVVSLPVSGACELVIARLRYDGGGDWYTGPSMLPNLVRAVRSETSLPVCDTTAVVAILDDDLFRYPFLFMTGHGTVRLSPAQRVRLREYLSAGGFLWADDNYGMDPSFRREVAALFPQNSLVTVPLAHRIYHARHSLPGLPKIHEHDGEPAQGLGVFSEGRLVIFYSWSADIGNGMEDPHLHDTPPEKHRLALQMGVNIVSWFFSP